MTVEKLPCIAVFGKYPLMLSSNKHILLFFDIRIKRFLTAIQSKANNICAMACEMSSCAAEAKQ